MNTQNVTFNVRDMHCTSCPKLIKVSLSEIDGVNEVQASLDTKTVTVDYDTSRVSIQLLIDAIKEVGYTASLQE